MATAKIQGWNSERGFGFVQTEQGRAFLHCSVIEPRPERGVNLEGKEVIVLEVAQGQKGLRVVSAEVGVWDPRLVFIPATGRWSGGKYAGWNELWDSGVNSGAPEIKIGNLGFATLGTVLNPKGTGRWNALVERSSHKTYLLDRVQTYEEAVLEHENRERSENGGWLLLELRDLIDEVCQSNPKKALLTPEGNDHLCYYRKRVKEGVASREALVVEIAKDLGNSPDQVYSTGPSSGWVIYNMRDEMQD